MPRCGPATTRPARRWHRYSAHLRVIRNIMYTMFRSGFRRSFAPVLRAFTAVVLAMSALMSGPADAASGDVLRLTPEQRRDLWERMTPEQRQQWRNARSPEERQGTWQRFSPEQRRETWQQMSPEQRELMLRRITPEQRQNLRGQMTPDEREAMRQRFLERQRDRQQVEQNVPPRQLSPEERQRLREQIEQARRDQYRRGNGGKGAGK